jgi:hypothetical protein
LGRHKKKLEDSLIRWRRKQVAERWFSGDDVKTIAEALEVGKTVIYEDIDYIETHADDLMRNYVVRTVPHIINRSLYQLDIANKEAMKILKDQGTNKREKIAASLAVSSNAKTVVDIITNNKSLIDAAFELDETVKQKAQEYLEESSDDNNELSEESTGTDTDPERVF